MWLLVIMEVRELQNLKCQDLQGLSPTKLFVKATMEYNLYTQIHLDSCRHSLYMTQGISGKTRFFVFQQAS